MRGKLGFGVAALLFVVAAGASPAAIKTSEITYKAEGEMIKAFLAEPDGPGPFPVVLLIHDSWGLHDWVKDSAKRFAEQGYVALAPDLYRGKVATDAKTAEGLANSPRDRALRDLESAINVLTLRKNVDKDRIGVIGWGTGGEYALQLAIFDEKRVKACVVCYGFVDNRPKLGTLETIKRLEAPVLGIFGEDDKEVTPEIVKKFEEALTKAEKKIEAIQIYAGAGQGFMRPKNGPDDNPDYRADQAKDAWKRIDSFFAKTLGGK